MRFIVLLIAIVIAGCTSETEEKAIVNIKELYGDNINLSKGTRVSTDAGTEKYIKVEINNPRFFEEGANLISVPGACALILYDNLNEEERKNIRII
jgi:hypothetical protein